MNDYIGPDLFWKKEKKKHIYLTRYFLEAFNFKPRTSRPLEEAREIFRNWKSCPIILLAAYLHWFPFAHSNQPKCMTWKAFAPASNSRFISYSLSSTPFPSK